MVNHVLERLSFFVVLFVMHTSKDNCTTIRPDLTQCQMLVGVDDFDCTANCVSARNCVNSLLWVELDRSTVSGPNKHLVGNGKSTVLQGNWQKKMKRSIAKNETLIF